MIYVETVIPVVLLHISEMMQFPLEKQWKQMKFITQSSDKFFLLILIFLDFHNNA